jgi:hypothetical protein
MFILKLSLSAILWSALGAMMAAYIVTGAIILLLLLGLIVFASRSGGTLPTHKKREVLSRI